MMRAPFFGTEGEHVERPADRQSADLVRDQPALLGGEAHAAQDGFGFHVWLPISSPAPVVGAATFRSAGAP